MFEIREEYRDYVWLGTLCGKFVQKKLGDLSQEELKEMYNYKVQHKFYKPKANKVEAVKVDTKKDEA